MFVKWNLQLFLINSLNLIKSENKIEKRFQMFDLFFRKHRRFENDMWLNTVNRFSIV